MAHTMDALDEEWEIIQAGINQDHFSLHSIINDTDTSSSLEAEKVSTTNDNYLPLYRYREPEHLIDRRLLQPNNEHQSSDTEEDQEANSVAEEEETGTKKSPWPVAWWKSQLNNLLKSLSVAGINYCKPFWCISVIATMFSLVVLKKRIFGMKHKQRKKETQFAAASTVRLNRTLSEVRRIPVIKIIPLVADANSWAIVHVK